MIERLLVPVLAGAAGELSSPEFTFCADSYSLSVPPLVTAVARKRPPVIPPKMQVGRLHLNMHSPLTQQSWSGLIALQAKCGNLLRK